MLRAASTINGYAIAASDGRIGTVNDFLFDDASWLFRWFVVDTGKWLSGRKVLLPPSVLGHPNLKTEEFAVRLTMQQVKDSPNIDTERPVSRQIETNIYNYYGWRPYWGGSGFLMGGYGGYGYGYGGGTIAPMPSLETRRRTEEIAAVQRSHDDPHLRSMDAVNGYHIHASDGEIGHVEDFLVEDEDWSIHYLVVDTTNWLPGKKVLISPQSIRAIDWTDNLVNLSVDRQRVKDSPAYDASVTVDRAYENHFHNYYGDVRPSGQP
jgi:sporulation protein YlmC with PRC-barrel domain